MPLAAHIRHVLNEREDRQAPRARFEFEHLNEGDADKTLGAAIKWGRYAELFSYDDEVRHVRPRPLDNVTDLMRQFDPSSRCSWSKALVWIKVQIDQTVQLPLVSARAGQLVQRVGQDVCAL